MALNVETGTGAADSESFASVADADLYLSNRGVAAWALLATEAKEQALRKATDYMEQVYRSRWAGDRVDDIQALSWPRYDVPREESSSGAIYYPDNIVPNEVRNACIELASKASTEELSPDIDRLTQREKLGPLEVEYDKTSAPYKKYRAIDNMLWHFLTGGSGSFRKLERV